jgi:hypothetical protein
MSLQPYAVPSVVWTGYLNMTIQAGNPGYFLVTNSSCLVAGCNVIVSSWGAAAEPNGRWLYDDRDRLRPLANIMVCLQYGSAGGLVTLQACDDNILTQKWDNVGEHPVRTPLVVWLCSTVAFRQPVNMLLSCCCLQNT